MNCIKWGEMTGMQRAHYHLSHVLSWLVRGQVEEAQAYIIQLMRCVHQVVLDGGGWADASLLLPVEDPLARREFGGTRRQLEVVAEYRKALADLKKNRALNLNPEDLKKEEEK